MTATPAAPAPKDTKVQKRRSRLRAGATQEIDYEKIAACFQLPMKEAAEKFGRCVSSFKKICRQHGIKRWPHRELKSFQSSLSYMTNHETGNFGIGVGGAIKNFQGDASTNVVLSTFTISETGKMTPTTTAPATITTPAGPATVGPPVASKPTVARAKSPVSGSSAVTDGPSPDQVAAALLLLPNAPVNRPVVAPAKASTSTSPKMSPMDGPMPRAANTPVLPPISTIAPRPVKPVADTTAASLKSSFEKWQPPQLAAADAKMAPVFYHSQLA
eukprot:GFYU01002251.1.p1 GENE.GFYU01002251.1~~GFYU01002251.1.p1  ORF type:complete len:273 (+),score=90.74 GFYU01002251.1:113-931(+)